VDVAIGVPISDIDGAIAGSAIAVGGGGAALHLTESGWRRLQSGVTSVLRSVWMLSDGTAWACGDDGVIVRFDGAAWQRVESGIATDLRAIRGGARHPASPIFVVGYDQTILEYDGHTWQQQRCDQQVGDLVALEVLADGGVRAYSPSGIGCRRTQRGWEAEPMPEPPENAYPNETLVGQTLYSVYQSQLFANWRPVREVASQDLWCIHGVDGWGIIIGTDMGSILTYRFSEECPSFH
jgi:hypothetical protein